MADKCPRCGGGLQNDTQDGYDECINPKCGWSEYATTHSPSEKEVTMADTEAKIPAEPADNPLKELGYETIPDEPKCGTCGGTGSIWITRGRDDEPDESAPCPDCTQKEDEFTKQVREFLALYKNDPRFNMTAEVHFLKDSLDEINRLQAENKKLDFIKEYQIRNGLSQGEPCPLCEFDKDGRCITRCNWCSEILFIESRCSNDGKIIESLRAKYQKSQSNLAAANEKIEKRDKLIQVLSNFPLVNKTATS